MLIQQLIAGLEKCRDFFLSNSQNPAVICIEQSEHLPDGFGLPIFFSHDNKAAERLHIVVYHVHRCFTSLFQHGSEIRGIYVKSLLKVVDGKPLIIFVRASRLVDSLETRDIVNKNQIQILCIRLLPPTHYQASKAGQAVRPLSLKNWINAPMMRLLRA